MEHNLSGMMVEERIKWHMERVEREEVLWTIKKRIRTGLTTGELRVKLAEVRDCMELCSRVLSVMEDPMFVREVQSLKGRVACLSNLQKKRAKLLSERYRKGKLNQEKYDDVMKRYFMVLNYCITSVQTLERLSDEKGLNADKYVSALFDFDGFEERYEECSTKTRLKNMTLLPIPTVVPLEKEEQVT